jgi:hypothetical protein
VDRLELSRFEVKIITITRHRPIALTDTCRSRQVSVVSIYEPFDSTLLPAFFDLCKRLFHSL